MFPTENPLTIDIFVEILELDPIWGFEFCQKYKEFVKTNLTQRLTVFASEKKRIDALLKKHLGETNIKVSFGT